MKQRQMQHGNDISLAHPMNIEIKYAADFFEYEPAWSGFAFQSMLGQPLDTSTTCCIILPKFPIVWYNKKRMYFWVLESGFEANLPKEIPFCCFLQPCSGDEISKNYFDIFQRKDWK